MDIKQSLKQHFGFDEFRHGQLQTIEQLLSGQSSLAIFPTGSGKSLCYQLTALHLPNLTLVVSPLLALMKDQLEFLTAHSIPAASIDSTLSYQEHQAIVQRLRAGEIKILMVSVERFKNERFRHLISSLPISMLVVDEAHCISEWGHNFRPDYLKLPQYAQELSIPLTLLLTATATRQVKYDMAQRFHIKAEHIVQTGFYRPNLHLSVIACDELNKKNELVKQVSAQRGDGIVYVTLQHTAEEGAANLKQKGINARAYHAGLANELRSQIQHDFMFGAIDVVVATIAFGMGVDKRDIRFVIHYDLPKSIENYSQEIGRAGRDGEISQCITLANLDGLTVLENFVYGDTPEKDSIALVIDTIKQEQVGTHWEVQLYQLSTLSNIKQLPLKTLLVQLELGGVLQPKFSYFAEVKFKFVISASEIIALFDGERRRFIETIFKYSPGKKVWYQPDFEAISGHSSSDRKRIMTALEYLSDKELIEIETKQVTDVYRVNHEKLNDIYLADSLSQYFEQIEKKEISRIGRLIDFFNEDNCLTWQLANYFDDSNAPHKCGHCSVCMGQVVKLTRSKAIHWPSDDEIQSATASLKAKVEPMIDHPMTTTSISRFLAGITVPVFTRHKVKSLNGFGLCQQIPYLAIKQKVEELLFTDE